MSPITVLWPTGPVLLSWQPGPACELPVTAAHGFCFAAGRVLVCQIEGRGWDIPGGHLEKGETPLEGFTRELWEEASARPDRTILAGHILVDNSLSSSSTGRYPRRSAIALFAVSLAPLAPHVPTEEACARQLVDLDALAQVHHAWNAVLEEGYFLARREISC